MFSKARDASVPSRRSSGHQAGTASSTGSATSGRLRGLRPVRRCPHRGDLTDNRNAPVPTSAPSSPATADPWPSPAPSRAVRPQGRGDGPKTVGEDELMASPSTPVRRSRRRGDEWMLTSARRPAEAPDGARRGAIPTDAADVEMVPSSRVEIDGESTAKRSSSSSSSSRTMTMYRTSGPTSTSGRILEAVEV